MSTKVVFMGTPTFAVPSLEGLVGLDGVEVVSVVTQPDRPSGRGRKLRPSAVKARALELGLPVWTPESLKNADEQQRLRDLVPDVLVVVAYGEILRRAVLDIPPYGALNVHGSLLPRHRGASPIAGALLAGETETGVTIMLMDEGMDTGPILTMERVPISQDDTRGTLFDKLSTLGADLLAETLPRWLAGEIEAQAQDHDAATYRRLIHKKHGKLKWKKAARQLANQIRAFDPWPGTFTTWRGKTLKILAATALPADSDLPTAPPGTVVQANRVVAITTGEGWLAPQKVQLAGKKAMPIKVFTNGYRDFVGSQLGQK
ncbi:MAG: methionyl-tRNA formyltransferase [Ardenticatenaceae bacterium]